MSLPPHLRPRLGQLFRLARPASRRCLSRGSRPTMLHASDLTPSAGEDPDVLLQQAAALVDRGRWRVCNEGKGLERAFQFKTFKTTWEFMNRVAAECQATRHHPEWSNVYNKTHIRWTTHNPAGLSSKDTAMARYCDEAAAALNELPGEASDGGVGADG